MKKDIFTPISTQKQLSNHARRVVDFLIREQYSDVELWKKFVNQFRIRPDGADVGWRGEFWGKAMRGAVMIYEACGDEELYAVLTDSVRDMLTVADEQGVVTSYAGENLFHYWDIWGRKYVLLAMEYYYEICRDFVLREQILKFCRGCADDILKHVGEGDGMVSIVDSHKWKGVNSSSVLEPMVRLYRLTQEKKYMDFSAYIIEKGGAEGINIFQLALENEKLPYQYGITKAYEMISCFEGIIEYYLVTGDEKYRLMAVQFGEAIAKSDVTIVGSCGCTHELFDHSTARQTAPYDGVMQETCVTVTWMKFCARLLCLTGKSNFADLIELAWFNAYQGAMNTRKNVSPYTRAHFEGELGYSGLVDSFLPFDSYSPLIAGKRGQKVAGNQVFEDGTYFGCCAAISGAGAGVYLHHALLRDANGIAIQFYERGEYEFDYNGESVLLNIISGYPIDGNIRIEMKRDQSNPLDLRCRIPAWSKGTKIASSFGEQKTEDGYVCWEQTTGSGWIELSLDMDVQVHRPIAWGSDRLFVEYERPAYRCIETDVVQGENELRYMALQRGPIMLCADSSLGKSADSVFDLEMDSFQILSAAEHDALLSCKIKDINDGEITLIDYASAGQDWNTTISVWLKV